MMSRSLLACTASALFLVAGCENQNGLTAGGPCDPGPEEPSTTPSSILSAEPRLPTAADLWRRVNAGTAPYFPRASSGISAQANAMVSTDALLEAMDIELALLESKSFTGNASQGGVFSAMGVLEPTEGDTMGWISTGVAGAGTPQSVDPMATAVQTGTDFFAACPGSDPFTNPEYDCAEVSFSFEVPEGMNSVRFDFAFMSAEYPEFVGLGFNDEFTVRLTSPTHSYDNIVFDDNGNMVNIDSAFFDEPCANLVGTGFDLDDGFGGCDAGGTGLLSTVAPVEPGEVATLAFSLRDRGDGIYDTAIMIDNVAVRTTDVDEPSTEPCD